MKSLILLTFLFALFCGEIYAKNYKLFKPKYAKIILSKDKKKAAKAERAEFMVRLLGKGGIIEVVVDAGPMFGIMKEAQTVDIF